MALYEAREIVAKDQGQGVCFQSDMGRPFPRRRRGAPLGMRSILVAGTGARYKDGSEVVLEPWLMPGTGTPCSVESPTEGSLQKGERETARRQKG